MVLFEIGIVASTDIGPTVDLVLAVWRLRGWFGGGQIGRVTLITAKGNFSTPASGQRKIVLVVAHLGRACSFPRHATAALLCLSGVGRATRQSVRVAEGVVRLGPGLFGASLLAVYPCRQVGVPGTPETLSTRNPRAVEFTAGSWN